jgi:hypothetical protein
MLVEVWPPVGQRNVVMLGMAQSQRLLPLLEVQVTVQEGQERRLPIPARGRVEIWRTQSAKVRMLNMNLQTQRSRLHHALQHPKEVVLQKFIICQKGGEGTG